MKRVVAVLHCFLLSFAIAFATPPTSPYAGQESRGIKALSQDEVDGYLAGKGMGFAKAAELNGFPGPAHVLALAKELHLSPVQRTATEALFAEMSEKARGLGQALVAKESELDQLFASKTITSTQLESELRAIGALHAQIRGAHLQAHLAQTAILTPEQLTNYVKLRGYAATVEQPAHEHHH